MAFFVVAFLVGLAVAALPVTVMVTVASAELVAPSEAVKVKASVPRKPDDGVYVRFGAFPLSRPCSGSSTMAYVTGVASGSLAFSTSRVDAIMTTEVDTLPDTATLNDARERFLTGQHSAYPIVDATGRFLGMISRRDLLGWSGDDGQPALLAARRHTATVGPAAPAQSALRVMVDEHVEHVAVTTGDETLVGICTRTDLLKVRRQQLEHERPQRRQPAAANAVRSMRPSTASKRNSSG